MRNQVLIVEDDQILRWLLKEAVSQFGHDVTECVNADDALLELNDKIFNLVITDVSMPGLCDGLNLAKVIWSSRPELPVLIVSGNTLLPPGFLPANARFLAKPCTLEDLSRTVEELLSAR